MAINGINGTNGTNGNGMKEEKSIPEIIEIKRDGGELSEVDIEEFVSKLVSGCVSEAQLGAWLMATYIHGLSVQETAWLTRAMVDTGVSMDWPVEWRHLCVDKHSTGGVGDKVSLVLAPALAATGLKVPMISGRGLGITGGTLDKLESIPGYRVQLSLTEIRDIVGDVGCCIAGQTKQLCPADKYHYHHHHIIVTIIITIIDKTMYAARDITNTVGCLGLIVSSIISKKAAEGINHLILDVKWGEGCYQDSLEKAEKLAEVLIQTSENVGVKTVAVISNMESPLGKSVGNSVEVEESVQCLRGGGSRDLRELVVVQGARLLVSSGQVTSLELGVSKMETVLDNGEALERFRRMIIRQGVSESVADQLCGGSSARVTTSTSSTTSVMTRGSGLVTKIGAGAVARLAIALGAGRSHPSDTLDLGAGVELLVEVGDVVEEGQQWAVIHHNKQIPASLLADLENCLVLNSDKTASTLPRISKIY